MPEKKSSAEHLPVPVELIERHIYVIRGQKVMLDSDLAELYQVPTKVLNQAVRRNSDRFPRRFYVSACGRRGFRLRWPALPALCVYRARRGHALAVLNSDRAVQMSIHIVRAFVRLCELLATHKIPGPQNRPKKKMTQTV